MVTTEKVFWEKLTRKGSVKLHFIKTVCLYILHIPKTDKPFNLLTSNAPTIISDLLRMFSHTPD